MTCPCCDGTGESALFRTIGCRWCQGGRISPEVAVRYANQAQGLTEGGMLYGEYSVDEVLEERRRCDAIRAEARALMAERRAER